MRAPKPAIFAGVLSLIVGPSAITAGATNPPESGAAEERLTSCDGKWASRVVEMQGHRRAPVVTAWLRNGVCVHHRRMEQPAGLVFVTINLIGGELLEGAESRGISMAAAAAWKGKELRGGAGDEARRLIRDRDVYIEAESTSASLQLRIWGSREDVEAGMRVVAELLSRPEVEAEAIEAAARQAEKTLAMLSNSEQGHLRTVLSTVLYPPTDKEPRTAPPSPARIRAFTPLAVQKWLDWHIESAPIEAAIVGDLSLEQAMKLAGGFLGRLPDRNRISSRTLTESRKLTPPPLPSDLRINADVPAGTALAVVGFMGGDESGPAELRAIQVGARLINERIKSELANSGVMHTGVGASVVPAAVYSGFGAVMISARVAAADADLATEVMTRVVRGFSLPPQNDRERIRQAAVPLENQARIFEEDQRWWSVTLARTETLGIEIDDLADAATAFATVDAAAINDAMRRNATPERMFRVIVTPKGG
ncbi:MAG: insulinase family protein [Phycisphaerales bacterium]|nr:insulinase family protein [Phycisphaerales bacterium]